MMRLTFLALVLGVVAANAQTPAPAAAPVCSVITARTPIATDARETSGLARGRRNPEVLWTHNDSRSEPEIFALGEDGGIRARIRIRGAGLTDWEDIEAGECGGQPCLYIADIGDNGRAREFVTVFEIIEPALVEGEAVVRRTLHARYEDGAQDAEALIRLPDGSLYIVTKGRHGGIRLYEFSDIEAQENTSLRFVRELAPQPADELDRVTAATASPDGRWIAVRTYRTLTLFRVEEFLRPGGVPAHTFSLVPLREIQGEAIALENDGTIWLSSEAENRKDLPTLGRVQCSLK